MNKRDTFTIGKFEYKAGKELYGKALKTFIFVDSSEVEPTAPAYTASDKEWKAHNKTVIALRRQILKDAGIDADKYSFSRTAGCSCGCSPAFTSKEESSITMFGKSTDYRILWITAKK